MKRRVTVDVIFVVLLWFFGSWSGLEAQEAENRYNVLFIAVDDLRPELGAYGRDYVNTPSIDRLADAGVTFTNHYVPSPTCGVSRYALLTGRSPSASGVTRNNMAMYRGRHAFSQEKKAGAKTLPELFRRSGYHTVDIGKISHTPDGKVLNKSDGSGSGRPELPHAWDEFATPYGPWEYGWAAFFAYPNGRRRGDNGLIDLMNFEVQRDTDLPDGLMAKKAVKKLEELSQTDDPFFMGLGFYKPHLPFVAPEKDRKAVENWDVPPTRHPEKLHSAYWNGGSGEFYKYDMPFKKSRPLSRSARMEVRKAYLACVRYVDRQVGKVLNALEETGLSDSTIVVLWGDHGWYLGEYAQWAKHTLLERATKSPLIIYHPDLQDRGRKVHATVDTIDLYPTLVDLANPTFQKTHWPLDGASLEPLLKGEENRVKPGALTFFSNGVSVRTRQWRLISTGSPGNWKKTELYDMRKGPESGQDVSDKHPGITQQLKKYMSRRISKNE